MNHDGHVTRLATAAGIPGDSGIHAGPAGDSDAARRRRAAAARGPDRAAARPPGREAPADSERLRQPDRLRGRVTAPPCQ